MQKLVDSHFLNHEFTYQPYKKTQFTIGLGKNRQVDNFGTLFGIWFAVTVSPSFYFMACADFRRDLKVHGMIKAFWMSVTKNNYDN